MLYNGGRAGRLPAVYELADAPAWYRFEAYDSAALAQLVQSISLGQKPVVEVGSVGLRRRQMIVHRLEKDRIHLSSPMPAAAVG